MTLFTIFNSCALAFSDSSLGCGECDSEKRDSCEQGSSQIIPDLITCNLSKQKNQIKSKLEENSFQFHQLSGVETGFPSSISNGSEYSAPNCALTMKADVINSTLRNETNSCPDLISENFDERTENKKNELSKNYNYDFSVAKKLSHIRSIQSKLYSPNTCINMCNTRMREVNDARLEAKNSYKMTWEIAPAEIVPDEESDDPYPQNEEDDIIDELTEGTLRQFGRQLRDIADEFALTNQINELPTSYDEFAMPLCRKLFPKFAVKYLLSTFCIVLCWKTANKML